MPDDHAEALRVEGREMDPQDRVSRRGQEGLLGNPRLLELRGALVQRSLFHRLTGTLVAEGATASRSSSVSTARSPGAGSLPVESRRRAEALRHTRPCATGRGLASYF